MTMYLETLRPLKENSGQGHTDCSRGKLETPHVLWEACRLHTGSVNPKDRWSKKQKQELGAQLTGGVPAAFQARALTLSYTSTSSLADSRQEVYHYATPRAFFNFYLQ